MKIKYIAFVLPFLLLTACGQKPEEPAAPAIETTAITTETTAATTATETEPTTTEAAATDADSGNVEEYLGGWMSEDRNWGILIMSNGSRILVNIHETGDPLETGVVHEHWDYEPTYQDGKLVAANGKKATNLWFVDVNGNYAGKSDVVYENGRAEFLLTPEGILWKNLTEEDMPDILFNDHLVQ